MHREIKMFLGEYLRDNLGKYILIGSFLLAGMVIGFLTVGWIAEPVHQELSGYFKQYTEEIPDEQGADYHHVFYSALQRNIPQVIIIYLAGLFIYGFPMVGAMVAWRGFTIGFTMGFLVEQAAINGLLFSLGAMLPHNILLLPAFLVLGVTGFNYSLQSFREQFIEKRPYKSRGIPGWYNIIMLLMALLVLAGCLVEAYISHFITNFIVPYLF